VKKAAKRRLWGAVTGAIFSLFFFGLFALALCGVALVVLYALVLS
jgi:hypothetical protein